MREDPRCDVSGPSALLFFPWQFASQKLRHCIWQNVPVGGVHGRVNGGARAALRVPSAEAVCWELVVAGEDGLGVKVPSEELEKTKRKWTRACMGCPSLSCHSRKKRGHGSLWTSVV